MFEVVHLVVGCSVLGSWLQGAEGAAHAAVCCHDRQHSCHDDITTGSTDE